MIYEKNQLIKITIVMRIPNFTIIIGAYISPFFGFGTLA